MVVGTAERHVQIFNLTNPNTAYKVGQYLEIDIVMLNFLVQTIASPLKWQTRVISCFTAATNSGFAVGSIEGRVAIQ